MKRVRPGSVGSVLHSRLAGSGFAILLILTPSNVVAQSLAAVASRTKPAQSDGAVASPLYTSQNLAPATAAGPTQVKPVETQAVKADPAPIASSTSTTSPNPAEVKDNRQAEHRRLQQQEIDGRLARLQVDASALEGRLQAISDSLRRSQPTAQASPAREEAEVVRALARIRSDIQHLEAARRAIGGAPR